MRVEQFLNDSAARFGARAAVVAGGRHHSYVELDRSSSRVAAALASHGVRRGDRVALFLDNTFEAVVTAFAVLKAGAVAAPIDANSDEAAVAAMLWRTGAVALVTEARLASTAASAMRGSRLVRLVMLCGGDRSTAGGSCLIFEEVAAGIGLGPDVQRPGPASDLAMLFQSTQPDGQPSDEELTHAQVIAAAAVASAGMPKLSSILSLYGVCQLLGAIRAGATLVLETPSIFRRALSSCAEDDAIVPALAG